jgi:hypothetical protein
MKALKNRTPQKKIKSVVELFFRLARSQGTIFELRQHGW